MSRLSLFVAVFVLVVGNAARADEKLVLVAGGGSESEGPAVKAKLVGPFGVAFAPGGTMFIVEMTGLRILKVDAKGMLTPFAGTGKKGDGGDDGPALQADFNGPHSLAVGPDGNVYVADTWNNRVRVIDTKSGKIRAFAGTGEKGFSGDSGPAAKAKFGGIYCIAFDPSGRQMYLADLDNRRIRAIDMKTRTVRTIAGNGEKGVPEDRAEALKAPLVDPRAVTADGEGNVYILERSGNALRVVDSKGLISTVAGTGKVGATGDGGDGPEGDLQWAEAPVHRRRRQRHHRRHGEPSDSQISPEGGEDCPCGRHRHEGHRRSGRATRQGGTGAAARRYREQRRHAVYQR